jgi:hypothetical protein
MQIEGRKALVLGSRKIRHRIGSLPAERGAVVALHDKKAVEEWTDEAKKLKGSHNVGLMSGQASVVAARPDRPGCDLAGCSDK